tara:strand:+ start:378 stop:1493 length:1116 start_codon:yes stop_codon:yes gene_type:complete
MKLLVNDKEIANYFLKLIGIPEEFKKIKPGDRTLAHIIAEHHIKKAKMGLHKPLEIDYKRKFANKLKKGITKDLDEYVEQVKTQKRNIFSAYFNSIHKNIETLLEKFGEERVLKAYSKDKKITEFVKGTGRSIDPKGELMRRHRFNSYTDDCVIRNTVGNEELLVTKIDKKYPMWFIDSGYTNFLEPNKKWHRLVRNHLHYGKAFACPADRLGNIAKFPKPWREGGEIIYVIEPGPFAASVFHVDLKTWKYDVEKELRKYTDKKIKFREKAPLRKRTNLYKELADEDYYCVVSINSNAATEAIWQGVPALTLDTHITNPVTKNRLEDINNLYRGPIADWLCMLTYQQFTKEELINGTAIKCLRKYNLLESE